MIESYRTADAVIEYGLVISLSVDIDEALRFVDEPLLLLVFPQRPTNSLR